MTMASNVLAQSPAKQAGVFSRIVAGSVFPVLSILAALVVLWYVFAVVM